MLQEFILLISQLNVATCKGDNLLPVIVAGKQQIACLVSPVLGY